MTQFSAHFCLFMPRNLGGKYSNATPPNHGGMSFGCSEDEEYQCDECNFKNKEKVAVAKHKKHQHEAKKQTREPLPVPAEPRAPLAPIMIHSTGIFSTVESEEVVQPRQKPKRRKSHTESLKPKSFSSSKVLNNSFREKYLTGIKKLSSLQEEHGGTPDFLLIVKNNVQQPSKQTTTAGKFMVAGQGEIFEEFMHEGIEFDTDSYVKMTNSWSMKTETDEDMGKLLQQKKVENSLRAERRRRRDLVAAMEQQERDEAREERAERSKRPRIEVNLDFDPDPEPIDQRVLSFDDL